MLFGLNKKVSVYSINRDLCMFVVSRAVGNFVKFYVSSFCFIEEERGL